mmetsp:Transcript_1333/g.1938  ORF Transcript_1333/g.1938 Transcript_1333/m.1938 type:complete len:212 (-) Transcript_1333:1164-1799(-)
MIWPLLVPIAIHFEGVAIASLSVLKSLPFTSALLSESLFLPSSSSSQSSKFMLSFSFPFLSLYALGPRIFSSSGVASSQKRQVTSPFIIAFTFSAVLLDPLFPLRVLFFPWRLTVDTLLLDGIDNSMPYAFCSITFFIIIFVFRPALISLGRFSSLNTYFDKYHSHNGNNDLFSSSSSTSQPQSSQVLLAFMISFSSQKSSVSLSYGFISS